MVTIYPSLRVLANGAVALVDAVDRGFQIVSIPDLTVRFAATYQNVVDVALSGFGAALGIWTTSDELVVVRDGRRQPYALPRNPTRIRGFAVSDRGDRLVLVLGGESRGESGSLEVWSLPAGEAPLAVAALPPIDRGAVAANPGCSRIGLVATTTAGSGPDFRAVYAVPGGGVAELQPLWSEDGAPLVGTAILLSDEWVWMVRGDGLVGWRGEEPPVSLPGLAFEKLIYSPTGSHLLASHVERPVGVTDAEVLFRLFDLTTVTEVARATHVVAHVAEAHPVVSPDLSLLIVRATRAGEVEVEKRGLVWSV